MTDRVISNPGVLLDTRIKKSPYYYGSRRHGVALYSFYNHHYHPRHYGDPFQEYWQLLEGVTLWDVGGAERQVEITGPDAFKFTNMLTPRDLKQCAVGQCKYAFITDERGGIINDPVLLRLAENHFWLSLADSDVLLWCKGLAHHSGLDVQISEPDVAPVQVQGPKSKEVMTELFGTEILEVPYYRMADRELDGMRLVISRTGYTGELGYELYLRDASRDGLKLWDALIQAGEPHGLSPTGPCHIRRIEGGILAHGCDMTIEENPYEVGYGYKWMVELEQEQNFMAATRCARSRSGASTVSWWASRSAEPGLGHTTTDPCPTSSRSVPAVARSGASRPPAIRRAWIATSGTRWSRSNTPSTAPRSRSSGPMRPSPVSSPTACSSSPSTPSSR
jgi:glycine cleavage system aminomethyltransferase T